MSSEVALSELQNHACEFLGGRRLLERWSDSRRSIKGNYTLSAQMKRNFLCLAHRPQSVQSDSQLIFFWELQPG
jgi:hypothetical protein